MKKYIKPRAETVDTALTRELAEQEFTTNGGNDNVKPGSQAITKDAGDWEDDWGSDW